MLFFEIQIERTWEKFVISLPFIEVNFFSAKFKSNIRETWRVILVSKADIFLSESLRILAERLSQSEIGLSLRQICYYSPPEEVGVFSTEIKISYFRQCLKNQYSRLIRQL